MRQIPESAYLRYITLLLPIIVITWFACKNPTSNPTIGEETKIESTKEVQFVNSFKDGMYCSEIEYYNPNTGTRSTYNLPVEVEDNKVIRINWPNGGWLDDSHFTPTVINDDGEVIFTSDAGYKYTVQVDDGGPCPGPGVVVWADGNCNRFLVKAGEWYIIAGRMWPERKLLIGERFIGRSWESTELDVMDEITHENQVWTIWMKTNSEKIAYDEIQKNCNISEKNM